MTADLELILLGTSSPLHSSHRFGPSQIVRGGDATVLIDCGWGATLRLYQAGLRPRARRGRPMSLEALRPPRRRSTGGRDPYQRIKPAPHVIHLPARFL